jgi:hypothetical protein
MFLKECFYCIIFNLNKQKAAAMRKCTGNTHVLFARTSWKTRHEVIRGLLGSAESVLEIRCGIPKEFWRSSRQPLGSNEKTIENDKTIVETLWPHIAAFL